MTDDVKALEPCPFCGGAAELFTGSNSIVRCQNDQCKIGSNDGFNDFSHRLDAITAWNTRPAQNAEVNPARTKKAVLGE